MPNHFFFFKRNGADKILGHRAVFSLVFNIDRGPLCHHKTEYLQCFLVRCWCENAVINMNRNEVLWWQLRGQGGCSLTEPGCCTICSSYIMLLNIWGWPLSHLFPIWGSLYLNVGLPIYAKIWRRNPTLL